MSRTLDAQEGRVLILNLRAKPGMRCIAVGVPNGRVREDGDEDAPGAEVDNRQWQDDEATSQWSWRQSDWHEWHWDSWKSEEYMPPPSW